MSDTYFSATYSDARGRFLAACLKAGARVTSHENPKRGPLGELLATDIAWLGAHDARKVLIVESGTHGVEGFCGSGIQVGLLTDPNAPRHAADTAMMLVHAINPFGFAWLRRVNEDNIDVNRNFVDHAGGRYPENPGYADLASALVPERWDEATRAQADALFAAYTKQHGEQEFSRAVKSGQHTHPDGIFFGGHAPSWSALLVARLCQEHLGGARHAALIDIHSGLGPYGYGEPLTTFHRDSEEERRARAWYGDDLVSTIAPKSAYAGSQGSVIVGYTRGAPHASWTPIGLEFGTRPPEAVRLAVRADAWLHKHGDLDSVQGREIKRALRDAFYPDDPAWRARVWARGAVMVGKALANLAAIRN